MTKIKQNNLLIISAHADDNVACAGTVFELTKEFGCVPYEVVLTNSNLGQDYKRKSEIGIKDVSKIRKQELARASKYLGIKKSFQLDNPDLGLKYSQATMFDLVRIIRAVKPSIVLLMNQYDAHPDHKVAYKLGVNAIKTAATGVKKVSLGAPCRVQLVLCCEGMLPIKTQILVDITKYLNKKLKLFSIYQSQASPKALEFERSLSTVRGYHLRKEKGKYAEAFTLQEVFPIILFDQYE